MTFWQNVLMLQRYVNIQMQISFDLAGKGLLNHVSTLTRIWVLSPRFFHGLIYYLGRGESFVSRSTPNSSVPDFVDDGVVGRSDLEGLDVRQHHHELFSADG